MDVGQLPNLLGYGAATKITTWKKYSAFAMDVGQLPNLLALIFSMWKNTILYVKEHCFVCERSVVEKL